MPKIQGGNFFYNLLIAEQEFVLSETPGASEKLRRWIMQRPINKIPITLVGRARRKNGSTDRTPRSIGEWAPSGL